MDTVPSEILAHIAGYVSYKDVNSLFRTSKAIYAKLGVHRRVLPKPPVELEITNDGCDKVIVFSVLSLCGNSDKKWCATLKDVPVGGRKRAELSEEGQRAKIFDFYTGMRRRGSQMYSMETSVDLEEGLSMHIQVLLSIARIQNMMLTIDKDDQMCEIITKQMTKLRANVDQLEVNSEVWPDRGPTDTRQYMTIKSPIPLRQSHLDVISACNPKTLEISEAESVPADFYKLAVVQKLTKLSVFAEKNTVYNLALLQAEELVIRNPYSNEETNITADDVKCFINQWLESRREIRLIQLQAAKGSTTMTGNR